MTNELLGAYDEVSWTGKRARDVLIPFYSWIETNFKRQVQMFRNGMAGNGWIEVDAKWAYRKLRQHLGGGGNGGGPRDPNGGSPAAGDEWERFNKTSLYGKALRYPLVALRLAITLESMGSFWMILWLMNHMCHHDAEEALPKSIQDRPHLIFFDNVGGQTWYFDRLGAIPDSLDTFGLDQFITDARDIWNGQQTWAGLMTKIMSAPVSKAANALNPFIKTTGELLFGKTIFPDAFNPRTIRDGWDYFFSSLGLKMPLGAIRELIDDRPNPKFWSREHLLNIIGYTANPKLEAYYDILDKKRHFQEDVLGKSFDGFATTKRGKCLTNMKMAMRYGDYKQAQRWAQRYYDLEGTTQGAMTSIRALDPYAGLSRQERGQFEDWLSKEDLKYLEMADEYYQEMAENLRDVM